MLSNTRSGFSGSHIVDELIELNHSVVTFEIKSVKETTVGISNEKKC